MAQPSGTLFALSQNYTRGLEWGTYLCDAYLLGGAARAAIGVESHGLTPQCAAAFTHQGP